MEEKINVAATLKDKPQGTKLYSRICGEVELKEVLDVRKKKSIVVKELNSSNQHRFWYDGKFFRAGQCVLQPSKEMADWSKFSWKKGDVLVNEDGSVHIIFEEFEDDAYTMFSGKYYYSKDGKKAYSYFRECDDVITEEFTLETEDAAQTYISAIEERLGGKLNRETLEIEKYQPEFKDGDVVVVDEIPFDLYSKCIFILKENLNTGEIKARAHVLYNVNKDSIFFDTPIMKVIERNIHLATEEEKQQLFSALEKKGKAWDADKKMTIDLKQKVELKPFDKVLVRDSKSDNWRANLFGYISKDGYYRCVYANWVYCIPYIGNEHLLGTTKDVED